MKKTIPQPLSEAEIQKKILKDCEVMKTVRVALSQSQSDLKNEEYEKGEFTSDKEERKFRQTDVAKKFVKDQKWRQRQLKKDSKRYGPLYIWSEKKKGSLQMAKAKKADEEKKATKKKDAKKNGKKDAKKAKKAGGKRGPRVVDGNIKLLTKENPKREGSKAWKRFELYKKNKTVASYLKAGGKKSSLRYDEKHKYIKLSNLKHKGDA